MTKHDLKELAAMGAELGAAKTENEKLRGLLREAAKFIDTGDMRGLNMIEVHAALSQQAEPTDAFTAVDMATAAAQGFRDGQAAVEPAQAQDEREAFDLFPDQLKALAERLKQYREAHKDDVCSPQEVLRQCKAWAGSDQYHGTGTGDSFQRAADLIEALLAARPAQTEQQPEQSALASAEWSEHGPSKPCPFHNPYLSKVDIRLRDGTEKFGELACNHTWFWYEHSQAVYDIVAFRPAPPCPPKEPHMASADIRPGPLIRQRRKALGITQPALAEQVGVNPTTLSRIEHGHNAGWTTIVALLQAVGAEVIVR